MADLLRRRRALRALGYAAAAAGEDSPEGPRPGLEAQRATIVDVCRRRGWSLVGVLEDKLDHGAHQPARGRALERISAGEADVLIAVRGDRLAPSIRSLNQLVQRSRNEGWHVCTLDSGLDTTTEAGLSVAEFLDYAARMPVRPVKVPIPPPELVFRVSGGDNEEWFRLSGQLHVDAFNNALGLDARSLGDFDAILDFGCGCGRLLPHIRARAPHARLFASDADADAVNWVRANFPDVEAAVNGARPPLQLDSRSVNLVICFSVFSHLDEEYQDAWLAELARVLTPDGRAVVTVNGAVSWSWHREGVLRNAPALGAMEADLRTRGFLHWRDDGWERFFPDYYHTSWHLPAYIRSRWSSWFDVLAVVDAGAGPTQDIVVLRPAAEHRGR